MIIIIFFIRYVRTSVNISLKQITERTGAMHITRINRKQVRQKKDRKRMGRKRGGEVEREDDNDDDDDTLLHKIGLSTSRLLKLFIFYFLFFTNLSLMTNGKADYNKLEYK